MYKYKQFSFRLAAFLCMALVLTMVFPIKTVHASIGKFNAGSCGTSSKFSFFADDVEWAKILPPALLVMPETSGPYCVKPSRDGGLIANNPAHGFTAGFSLDGVRLGRGATTSLVLKLLAYGNRDNLQTAQKATPIAEGATVAFRHGDTLTEWYLNSSAGLEQGFTFHKPPAGNDASDVLVLRLSVDQHGSGLTSQNKRLIFKDSTGNNIALDNLHAFDARGKNLKAVMNLFNNELVIRVDATDAVYPVVVDPLLSAKTNIVASDSAASDEFGEAVSIAGDTLVVGAPLSDPNGVGQAGSAYIFIRDRDADGRVVWTQQAKLTAPILASGAEFGQSVKIQNGTIIVGTITANKVYVLERNSHPDGSVTWDLQQELTAPTVPSDRFGLEVSIDGDTIVASARNQAVNGLTEAGSAYVFQKTVDTAGTVTWVQQARLVADDAESTAWFGSAVAVSGDLALIGAREDDIDTDLDGVKEAGVGSAYIFRRTIGTGGTVSWTQEAKLIASDAIQGDNVGWAAALEGNTAVVTAGYGGAAYIFERSINGNGVASWTQTAKLQVGVRGGAVWDVAISGDSVLTAGGKLFVKPTTGWTDMPASLSLGGYKGVAIDGEVAIVAYSPDNVATIFETGLDLSLVKQDNTNNTPALTGTNIDYDLIVTNNDTEFDASNVILTDQLPAGATYNQSQNPSNCAYDNLQHLVRCDLGNILSGQTVTTTLSVTGDKAGYIENVAHAYAAQGDQDLANNTDSVTTGINTPPVVSDQTISIDEDTPLAASFPVEDADSEQLLSFTIATAPIKGTVTVDAANRAFVYTPAKNANGIDSFTFFVVDGFVKTGEAVVTINITPVNDTPEPMEDHYSFLSGSDLSVAVPGLLSNDTDPEGDALQVNVTPLSGPANGLLTLNADGSFIYKHNGGTTTSDLFMYEVNDGKGGVATATVYLLRLQDSDGDGVEDSKDAFPNDPKEWLDSDGDHVGDNSDVFPNDPTEWKDSDGDGVGDNADAFPLDANETQDSDRDGIGDTADAFPNDPSEWVDTDGDGIGDNADTDNDNDGTPDVSDFYPNDPTRSALVPPDYLPLNPGSTWFYDSTGEKPVQLDQLVVISDTAIWPLQFPTGSKLYFSSNSQKLTFFGAYLPSVITDVGEFSVDIQLNKGMTLLPDKPTRNIYLNETGNGTITIKPTYGSNAMDWEGYSVYLGPETVTVPAGQYETLHVRIGFQASTVVEGAKVYIGYEADFWLADGVGIVKMNESGVTSQLTKADVVTSQVSSGSPPASGGGGGSSNYAILILLLFYIVKRYSLFESRFGFVIRRWVHRV